jgi:hypothetical protein
LGEFIGSMAVNVTATKVKALEASILHQHVPDIGDPLQSCIT